MSLVIHEPTSLVSVAEQCDMVERWAETCESIAELRDASNKLAAIDEYLHRTNIEGRGRLAATLRRLEVRIGALLGTSPGRGRPTEKLHHDVNFSHQQRNQFRDMAEHSDIVEALAEQSTDEHPLSRRRVLQAIADAQRQLDQERDGRTQARHLEAMHQSEDFNPKVDTELTRQRGALRRACEEITAMADPAKFITAHADYKQQLRNILPTAVAARQWLDTFIAATGDNQ